jgi:hypothetical protein
MVIDVMLSMRVATTLSQTLVQDHTSRSKNESKNSDITRLSDGTNPQHWQVKPPGSLEDQVHI